MKYALRFLIFLVVCIIAAFSATTASANTSTLKCNSQKDTVWLYDSLTSFDVQAKLACGESVEVLDRANGYVRVRARNGVEGYIPESAFADLPPVQIQRDSSHDVGYVAKTVQAKEIAKVAASNAAFATRDNNSSNASPQVAMNTPAGNAPSRDANTGRASILPTEMAEMSPRRTATPVIKTSATVPEKVSVAETVAPSSNSLDAASPAGSQPLPAATAVMATGPAHSAIAAAETPDVPESRLESDTQNLNCRNYFSAYGLTANQLKWIAQNRSKAFPDVCPAPTVSKVNYVIIFTHDVSFFGGTLPDAVHNLNGFSDFRPMTPVDNALESESEADKAHRQYVWVFHVADGAFNPETFSPRRAVQFSKIETNSLGSKAGPKAVEDAFRYLENADR
jgi:hypothetical protein